MLVAVGMWSVEFAEVKNRPKLKYQELFQCMLILRNWELESIVGLDRDESLMWDEVPHTERSERLFEWTRSDRYFLSRVYFGVESLQGIKPYVHVLEGLKIGLKRA